jgi:hypothetical protein
MSKAKPAGTGVIWPKGLEEIWGISAVTRWRWERAGRLPTRDVFLDGQPVGWRPETLQRHMSGNGPGCVR